MRKSLIKILWSNHKKTNLIGASFGMILGFIIILTSLQIFIDVQTKLIQDEQIFKAEFIVINKKISLLNTLMVANSSFSKEDIDDISKQEFTEKVGKFISNKFKLGAYTNANGSMPAFYSELFFEAVEDEFLDVQPDKWKWREGDNVVPIIMPRDYLTLYNFGFAQSQGLPQMTEDIIGKAAFNLKIEGNGKKTEYIGKIVGFSGKINSILVPYKFLIWANNEYGENVDTSIANRLVLLIKDPTNPNVTKYLDEKAYQSNNQNEKIGKIASLLKVIISIVGIIGVAIILLSVMVFILSFNVIIAKSTESILKLIQIGFHYKTIFRLYFYFYSLMLVIVLFISVAILFPLKSGINSVFMMAGFSLDSFPHYYVFIFATLLAVFLLLISALSLNRMLKKLTIT